MSRVVVSLAAAIALTLSACSGAPDDYVSPLTDADIELLNEQIGEMPSQDELAAINEPAPDAESAADDGPADAAAETIPTLPGQGATLAPDAQTIGHWQYFPAKSWTLAEDNDDAGDHFSTETGTADVRVLAAAIGGAHVQVGLISDRVAASHGEVEVYDSGMYEHANGYPVAWVRFDIIEDGVWTPGQRFWILADEATLEVEVLGHDAESFDDELFTVQGVVNEVDCPDKA